MIKRSLIIGLCLISTFLFAQNQNFKQNFQDKTLRIDYQHIGNSKMDTIRFASAHFYDKWSGTQTNIIDKFGYGANYVEVYDSLSNQLIYSRGYCNLFEEWRTTPEGKLETKSFEETTLIPFPKKAIKVVYKRRSREGQYSEISSFYLNPTRINKSTIQKQKTLSLHKGGLSAQCLDVTFVADGYAVSDSLKLVKDFNRYASYFLNCRPFSKYKKQINIIGILGFSKESGITDPNSNIYKKTAVGCTFNSIGSDRYLMTTNIWDLQNIVESTPTDAIMIICNTSKYGGGGIYNYYATVAADDPSGNYILVHEGGHCIAGLADEYYSSSVTVEDFYSLTAEPWEPNITTMVAFDRKWKNQMSIKTPIPTPATSDYENVIGVFEGAGYMAKGIYRPWQNCTMKEIKYDGFCPVCQNAIKAMVNYYSK